MAVVLVLRNGIIVEVGWDKVSVAGHSISFEELVELELDRTEIFSKKLAFKLFSLKFSF